MKPNFPLKQHIVTNTKLALQIRITIIFIALTLGLIWIFTNHDANTTQTEIKKQIKIAANLTRSTIDDLAQSKALNMLENSERNYLQLKMDYFKKTLNCSLYVINNQGELLFTGSNGGPLGRTEGQQINDIKPLASAMSSLFATQKISSYEGPEGLHLLTMLPLQSPNTYIIGEAPIAPWSRRLGESLSLALLFSICLLFLARHWIKQSIRDWRRQNLSQTIIDPLINQPNRHGMELFIQQTLAAPHNILSTDTLLLIRLDHFSDINIRYGIRAGDMVLKQMSNMIRSLLHKKDIIGRWNGDTFILLHKGLSGTNATAIAKKIICETNKMNFDFTNDTVEIHLSIGVHTINTSDSLDFTLIQAEQALQKAKREECHLISEP